MKNLKQFFIKSFERYTVNVKFPFIVAPLVQTVEKFLKFLFDCLGIRKIEGFYDYPR